MGAFALLDCNSFFCSCERIFRPDLAQRPVIVLSNNDGCAIARTDEAKKLGIKMGDPYFKIKELCDKHGVAVFSSNFALYSNISQRVMSLLKQEFEHVEVYSVDEAFFDLSGSSQFEKTGREIRDRVLRQIKIPTSVGIAPTKVLAKVANHLAKKTPKAGGVVNLMRPDLQDIALEKIAIEDVWGVGRAYAQGMRALGIKTAKELRDFPNEKLIQNKFTKIGRQLQQELRGVSCFDLEEKRPRKKEIMCSRSFSPRISDKERLFEAIADFLSDAAQKLRAQGSLCLQLEVFAWTSPFLEQGPSYRLAQERKLSYPCADTFELIKIARGLFEKGFREGIEYQKAGVKLSNFYDHDHFQLDLFTRKESLERNVALMNVLDAVNAKFGKSALTSLACSKANLMTKRTRQDFRSPRYTTSWDELPIFN